MTSPADQFNQRTIAEFRAACQQKTSRTMPVVALTRRDAPAPEAGA